MVFNSLARLRPRRPLTGVLTCYGWLIFRAPSPGKLRELTRSLFFDFEPSTVDVTGIQF
jgi:hypothetical protein